MASGHRPNYVLQVLSELVESSCIISPERFRMDQNLTFLHDCHGACERLLKTPIPLSYTRCALLCFRQIFRLPIHCQIALLQAHSQIESQA